MDQLTPNDSGDDPGEGTDAGGSDAEEARLAPRVPPAARRRRRNPFALASLVLVVVALGVVVTMGLSDATLFFRNADEAVSQRDDLGDRRFRIQGLVDGETITDTPRGVDFVITHNGVEVTIAHLGDPPDLFQSGIPVVLEGSWARVGETDAPLPSDGLPTDDGWFFASDRFFVKHTEVYAEEHPDRTGEYGDDGYGDDGDGEGDGGSDGGTEADPVR